MNTKRKFVNHINYGFVRDKIRVKYGSYTNFEKVVGWSSKTIMNKLKGKVSLTSQDVLLLAEVLDIKKEDIGLYFFTT